ncbi:MAG: hypothetical protein K9J37_04375 [Saprospiraceae bacterium]|nr:hypothetical protein [Saprospiraceae bacterium]MCF8249121.1 hypothetical protein [Saprospiraceae bacterium]MCF8281378.1 hypothetical protein [Bacteroidales bacterium]MCF8311143.1 hypothetical protein [Saprospiraceae bacterium]MCF8440233.1 hypothetical protein [Saprospiraceae bacterium]
MEILTNDTINIQRIFESVNFDIPKHGSLEGIPETLQKRVTDFRDIVAAAGNNSFQALDSMPVGDPEEALSLFFHFQFADRAKQLLLLCRDVLFQHLKGKLLVADGKMKEAQLEKHIVQSEGIIDNATLEFKEWSEREIVALKSQAPSTTKNLKNWRLQTNPWPVFQEQMDAICEQCAFLMENHQQAEAHRLVFKAIHALTFETLGQCSKEGAKVSKISKDTLHWLENATDETPGKIATKLEQTEDNLALPNHLDIFTQKMEALTEALPSKWQITTAPRAGCCCAMIWT